MAEIRNKETDENEINIDEVVKMLDGFASSDVSRLKIDVS